MTRPGVTPESGDVIGTHNGRTIGTIRTGACRQAASSRSGRSVGDVGEDDSAVADAEVRGRAVSELDEPTRSDLAADGGVERRQAAPGTLRSDLHVRLDAIEVELAELRKLIEGLPQTIRRTVWSKLG